MSVSTRGDYRAVAEYVLAVLPLLHDNKNHSPTQIGKFQKIFLQGLRNQIFDLGDYKTGYISEKAFEFLQNGGSRSKLTGEHIYPRTGRAKQILKRVIRGNISVERLTAWIMSSCRCHTVTREENRRLMSYQKCSNYHWREGYKKAGISLIKDNVEPKSKYVYIINGIEYNSITKAAKANGCSVHNVNDRCTTKAIKSKWKSWKRYERITSCTSRMR